MDKLVGAFLEGTIEKENYLKKKDELLKEKSNLKLKYSGFGQKVKSWVEPLRDWVKTAHYAGKMTNSDMDLSEFKSFSEKVGSNRLLKDKKIVFDWLPPYDILAKDSELQRKSPSSLQHKKVGSKKELLRWYSILIQVRSFFMNGTKV